MNGSRRAIHLLSLLVSTASLPAKIRAIDRLWDIEPDVAPGTLVLLDVDETLVIFSDLMLRGEARAQRREMLKAGSKDRQQQLRMWSIAAKEAQVELIEPTVGVLLRRLRQKGALVLGLTCCPIQSIGVIEDMGLWRIRHLQQLGIDFSLGLPIDFPIRTRAPLIAGKEPQGQAWYRRGIIFTADREKGLVLHSFLDLTGYRPSKIIFVDDLLPFVKSVEQSARLLGLPFQGFHYRGAKRLRKPIDPRVYDAQKEALIQERRWLSDREAKKRLAPSVAP